MFILSSHLDKRSNNKVRFLTTYHNPKAQKPGPEIDLFELAHSFWQQKKLIAATAALAGFMALGYALWAQPVYQTSSLLRPVAINELDALNRSEVYKLPPEDALLKVGSALESYDTRLNYFRTHQDLFKPLERQGISLEQSFELFNRDAIKLTLPDPNKAGALTSSIKLELTYPGMVNGVEILNGFVEYAINNQREQISADLKVIINNRLRELEAKINAARSSYRSEKEGEIATLVEADTRKRAELEDELQALRLELKIERDARVAQLSEAISIARSLGYTHPTTPMSIADSVQGSSSRQMRTEITSQTMPLYFMGTQVLEAERAALLKRTNDDFTDERIAKTTKKLKLLEVNRRVEMLVNRANEDLYLKYIEPLRAEAVRLGSLNTDMSRLGLASIDRMAQTPTDPIKPKKALIVVLGVLVGLLVGLCIATARYLINRRKQAL